MIIGIIIGLVAGLLIGSIVMFLVTPSLLFRETASPAGFDDTVKKVEEAAIGRGWKIPGTHDLQATLKKFGKDVRSVKVFEICHPDLSYRILQRNKERIASSMMPCRVAVYEREDGTVWISRMNSGVVAMPMTRVVRKTMTAAAADVEEIIADVVEE
jgi:uncharacterized protein (DUF302 family)